MKCEKSSVCCNKKSNFLEPVPIVDGVAVPDSGIEGVFDPDSSGDDSDPLSDILIRKSERGYLVKRCVVLSIYVGLTK